MKKAKLIMDRDFAIGKIDPRIYGSFIEHLGRAVYGGIYEPGHPTADENGFRRDVIEMVRRLGVPVVRYPGGNFVSGFNWEDSVGPREQRPRRLDLAWFTTETNEVGLHEFANWAKKGGYAGHVRRQSGLPGRGRRPERGGICQSSLRQLLERPAHSATARRIPSASSSGAWATKWTAPGRCATRRPRSTAVPPAKPGKMMKWVDPTIELVACGSSSYEMSTFGSWEYQMLDECYDQIDYVSLHRYYGNPSNQTADFLARNMDLDAFIKTVVSICDAVKGKEAQQKAGQSVLRRVERLVPLQSAGSGNLEAG